MDVQTEEKHGRKKILEPTYHFSSELIKIGDDYTTDKIAVSELVRSGQLLVDFPNFQRFANKGFTKHAIEPGACAHLSEDGESIHATVAGYPKIQIIRRPDSPDPLTVISVEPLLIIAQDRMQVSLAIHPPLENGHSLQKEDIKELLAEEGIVFGINHSTIEEITAFINEESNEFKSFVIANGQTAGKSTNAYLRYDMEIGPIAGTVLDNGNIDFRERRIMVGVLANQCIATKIPAIQGKPGINVYGQETPAPPGQDIIIRVQGDARFSEETMQVTATKDGVLSIVNNHVIKVLSHQTISSNIDFETGNIESMNAITILGSVQPGFRVTVGGDLKISGSVLSASVICNGNLVVRGGTTGKNCTLQVQGDADINFIERGSLQCGGIAVIRKQSYYSEITAGSDVRCQNLSIVMGGRIVAEGNITLGNVGSENSTPALIAAGTVAERLVHLQELKTSIVQQQDAIIQWIQRYRGSSTSKKIRRMERQLAETKLLLLRVNLIPGTGRYSRIAGSDEQNKVDIGKVEQDADYSSDGAIAIENIKIDVVGTIFAGTIIQIGNRTLKLDKTVSKRQFKLHANGKRILAVPLKR
ncbi:DUF342 domain-containing protein [Desulfopila sp. IMCC35006]|uniref:DUF342 domain-containing protein n=1 Tax=Desulfopila sp. IMCC35006 TaxID=2569542 RepID=UPI0010AD7787|nr:FapA family protein [Desulfopila sp. IMCC35006]TKB27702.1 DUF342 domain-containing protein [Desulfopila sp. IMCC35006]